MTDTLLPSHAKSILKGLIRSAQSVSLFLFVSIMAFLPHPTAFWTMAGFLLLASPILYVYIPELRSLGRAAGGLYFLPIQTKFYAVIPRGEARVRSFKDAAVLVKNALRITSVGKTKERSRSKQMSFRNKMTPSEAGDARGGQGGRQGIQGGQEGCPRGQGKSRGSKRVKRGVRGVRGAQGIAWVI